MQIVESYDELDAELRKLRAENRLLYRGQRRNYPKMTSSLGRKVGESTTEDVMPLLGQNVAWRQAAETIALEQLPLPPVGEADHIPPAARMILATAIVQHYGFASEFVDVTLNPDVALWFALTEYHEEYVLEGPESMPRLVKKAWYTPSKERFGYLYVFDRPKWSPHAIRHGDSIDLTVIVRPGHSRIQRQMAASLFCGATKRGIGDMKRLVRTTYKFPNPLPGAIDAFRRMLDLFPDPTADPIYRSLLQSRFIETTYVSDLPKLFVRRVEPQPGVSFYVAKELKAYEGTRFAARPLDIPEYHAAFTAEEHAAFRSIDRVLTPTLYFAWAKTRLKAKSRPYAPALKLVAKARPVLVNAPLHHLRELAEHLHVTKPLRPPAWARNVFFEFNPHNFVGAYSSERTVRGIWLFGDGRTFAINVFGAENGEPWYGEFCAFQWESTRYVATTDLDVKIMSGFLLLGLSVISEVVSQRANLILPKRRSEYGQINWEPTRDLGIRHPEPEVPNLRRLRQNGAKAKAD